MQDKRIKEYQYLKQLKEYISTAKKQQINGMEYIYPRQLEIHLPGNRRHACNAHCKHCFGTFYSKNLSPWESRGIKLLHELKGAIPFQIYGGTYTEPTMNQYLFAYLDTTKYYDNHFGIHTNAINLNEDFLRDLNSIATDRVDYLSISLDAGSGIGWGDLKHKESDKFWNILNNIEKACSMRRTHAIRIVCLMSNPKPEEIEFIVSFAKMVKVDSVRFSIPYDFYNEDFQRVREHLKMEKKIEKDFERILNPLVSENEDEIPYIFWNPPYFTDINRFTFNKCHYGLFQITLGADGYVYPCSAVAAPTAQHLRIGEITGNLKEFQLQCAIVQNQNLEVKKTCFEKGLRCNRMGLEINEAFNDI